ncbi:MAG: FxsA family protein [Pseudohongiella sp.]|nr:FxsA family protein [Pseudohongiella sp.]
MRFPMLMFLVIPIAELYLLFAVADVIGGLATLLLVILTAFTGITVLRRQGLTTLRRADQRLRSGQMPGQEIVEALLLTFAGALLITPGLLTDCIGFALLTPAIRGRLATRVLAKGNGMFMGGFYSTSRSDGFSGFGRPADDTSGSVIDGEVVDRDRPRDDERLP